MNKRETKKINLIITFIEEILCAFHMTFCTFIADVSFIANYSVDGRFFDHSCVCLLLDCFLIVGRACGPSASARSLSFSFSLSAFIYRLLALIQINWCFLVGDSMTRRGATIGWFVSFFDPTQTNEWLLLDSSEIPKECDHFMIESLLNDFWRRCHSKYELQTDAHPVISIKYG